MINAALRHEALTEEQVAFSNKLSTCPRCSGAATWSFETWKQSDRSEHLAILPCISPFRESLLHLLQGQWWANKVFAHIFQQCKRWRTTKGDFSPVLQGFAGVTAQFLEFTVMLHNRLLRTTEPWRRMGEEPASQERDASNTEGVRSEYKRVEYELTRKHRSTASS